MVKNKQILAFLMIVVFLVGTIGITTYKHICSKDGISISLFIPNNSECPNEEISKMETHDCCHQDKQIDKNHCCNNEISSYKVHSDFIYEIHKLDISSLNAVFLVPVFHFLSFFSISNLKEQFQFKIPSTEPPVLYQGKDLLGFLSIWRL